MGALDIPFVNVCCTHAVTAFIEPVKSYRNSCS